jgi:hypothetical protein
MIAYLDKLNLRPAEKRLVVLAVLALFVVINAIFIWPRFGEWGRLEQQMKDSRARLAKYEAELGKQSAYKKELQRLQGIGHSVPAEDQALDLSTTLTAQAALSGVYVQSLQAERKMMASSKTNRFFEEKTATMQVNAMEQQLVDFLYLLGNGDSLIRARSMTVVPDNTKMRLNVNLTLVASYQKRPPAKGATSAGAAPSAPPPRIAASNPAPPAASPFKAAPPPPPKTNTAAAKTNSSLLRASATTNAPAKAGTPAKPK